MMRHVGMALALCLALLAASQEPAQRPQAAAPGPWRTTYVQWQLAEEQAENARLQEEVAELRQENARLAGELVQATEAVLAAEQKFQDWLQVLSG
ncbi:MAG: hypothetical protein P1V81_02750, partial [Planctomycetota bacterium]|nr:hypothetical protein [Planctomycetota bacterium]